jgi:hypothetical protein
MTQRLSFLEQNRAALNRYIEAMDRTDREGRLPNARANSAS